jgi:hypothetical protein
LSLSTPIKGITPVDVWGYPTRTLTERFVVIERVPPRYDASLTLISRTHRFVRANTIFNGISSDVVIIGGIPELDLLPTFTETILLSGFDTAPMKDYDDTTYTTGIATSSTPTDHVMYDMGRLRDVVILAVIRGTSMGSSCRVAVSPDNVTYTNVIDSGGRTTRATYIALATGVRYIKLLGFDYGPGFSACEWYTLEVYERVNRRIYVNDRDRVLPVTFITRGYSHILEVIQL